MTVESEAYYEWLCDKIDLVPGTFDILIRELYGLSFRWKLDLDENRAEDGYVLRGYFHNPDGSTALDALSDRPCSILEMLIALAQKMDYLMSDTGRGDRTKIWFWEMLENLGLTAFSDDSFDEPFGDDMTRLGEIRSICDRWMDREFTYRGYGSPFPLMSPQRDQRDQHMIDQMNDYVLENYVVDD